MYQIVETKGKNVEVVATFPDLESAEHGFPHFYAVDGGKLSILATGEQSEPVAA